MSGAGLSLADLADRQLISAAGVFSLIADESCIDGLIDDAEKDLLRGAARLLKLDSKVARALMERSARRYAEGHLGAPRPFDGIGLYRKVLRSSLAFAQASVRQVRWLPGLRKLLGVSDAVHRNILAELQSSRR